ncbi:RHS repeat-associated core domain-containing protein [Amycolatopsis sp. NPDC054798]
MPGRHRQRGSARNCQHRRRCAQFVAAPYGGNTATGPNAADNPFHYLGQYQYGVDMLLGYRWYFPGWGRFLTPDPTGQEANHYAYAQNDPGNNSDPPETAEKGRFPAV